MTDYKKHENTVMIFIGKLENKDGLNNNQAKTFKVIEKWIRKNTIVAILEDSYW